MQISNIPVRYQKVWGVNAAGAYIRTVPVNSQIGIQDGAASFNDGFVPDNFAPVAAGGVPPFGQDFNGILNVETSWMQWVQAGGPIPFDATFAAAIGGYPKGAVLASAIVQGAQWYSTTDNNTTDPDDPLTSSGWTRVGIAAGVLLPFLSAVPTGFVQSRGDWTLGNLTSGANYASADALFLYAANWPNSQLLIYTSGGVATTRGANAAADFAAGKRLQLPDARGAGLIGVDAGSSANLSGVPVIGGNTTTPGSMIGENLHALTSSENGPHDHSVFLKDNTHTHGTSGTLANAAAVSGNNNGGGGGTFGVILGGMSITSSSANITIGSVNGVANDNKTAQSGSGAAHNNVERSLGVNWGQKL